MRPTALDRPVGSSRARNLIFFNGLLTRGYPKVRFGKSAPRTETILNFRARHSRREQRANTRNAERPHQSRGNVPLPEAERADAGEPALLPFPSGAVKCRERIGGALKHYYRDSA